MPVKGDSHGPFTFGLTWSGLVNFTVRWVRQKIGWKDQLEVIGAIYDIWRIFSPTWTICKEYFPYWECPRSRFLCERDKQRKLRFRYCYHHIQSIKSGCKASVHSRIWRGWQTTNGILRRLYRCSRVVQRRKRSWIWNCRTVMDINTLRSWDFPRMIGWI